MIRLRKAEERGHFDHGWLDTWHTFSFGDYWDPENMGFSDLRVINEDRVAPGGGFPKHPHRDMEIVTWVLDGGLQHRDNMGNGSVITPGRVQRMTAGSGVTHSESNASKEKPVHLLQIWILPEARNLTPGYEEKHLDDFDGSGFRLVGSRDGRDGSVMIHQDVSLFVARLGSDEAAGMELRDGRRAWLQVARGAVLLGEFELSAGDGAAITDVRQLDVKAGNDGAELLLFDLR